MREILKAIVIVHEILLDTIRENIHDRRLYKLILLILAGYMEDWKYGNTNSGTPQGGVNAQHCAITYLTD